MSMWAILWTEYQPSVVQSQWSILPKYQRPCFLVNQGFLITHLALSSLLLHNVVLSMSSWANVSFTQLATVCPVFLFLVDSLCCSFVKCSKPEVFSLINKRAAGFYSSQIGNTLDFKFKYNMSWLKIAPMVSLVSPVLLVLQEYLVGSMRTSSLRKRH